MASPALNEDILHLLLPFPRKGKTVLAIMLTCRSLYTAGMPWLLRLRYQLSTDTLQKSYTYLLADAPNRFASLRDLVVVRGPHWLGNTDDIETIADILGRAVNLKVLRFYHFWARTFIPFPSTLRHLEQLHLDNLSAVGIEHVLNCLQCPLKRIHIGLYDSPFQKYYTMAQLSKFSTTLECVVGGGQMCRENLPVESNVVFPHVVSFRETHDPPLRVAVLRVFPNLKILALRKPSDVFNRVGVVWHDPNAQTHPPRRMLNIASNIYNGSGDPLVYLDIDTLSLYTLALECRVTYLVVRMLNISQDRDLAWFHASLAAMRPTYLRFYRVVGRPSRFAEVLSHGTDDVRKLWMHLVITSKRGQYQEGLDALIDALPRGLRVFECKISAAWAKGERRGKGGDTTLAHHPATQFLHKLKKKIKALVQRAFVSAPELFAVRIEILPGKTGPASKKYYWLATKGTTPSLRATSAEKYKAASCIEREVITFLKENHYGYL